MRSGIYCLIAFLACGAVFAQQAEVAYVDDFQSYGAHANPPGWVDTSVGSAKPEANGLYKTWPDPLQGNQGANLVFGTKQSSGKPEGNNPRIGTFSTLSTKTFAGNGRFEYGGRFIRTNNDTRIGLSFFSSYPEQDKYYLVGLWSVPNSASLTMQLFAFGGGSPAGTLDSGFTPETNKWVRFLIQVDDADNATRIRVRLWLDGTPEPSTFAIDATDSAASRLKQGRIGIWSAVKGDAYVDDLSAKSPVDHTGPGITFTESGVQLAADSLTKLNHDARVDVQANDLSGVASLTVTLDGNPYTPLTPITVEGPHTIAAVAVDRVGNRSDSQAQVLIDKTAPVVRVTGVTEGMLVNRAVVPLFAAEDLTGVTLTATLDGNAITSGTSIGTDGLHTLIVTATDAVGWTSSATVNFTIDRTPPTIAFTSPSADQRLSTHTILTRGTFAEAVRVTVNTLEAQLQADAFAAEVPLLEGENVLIATAYDAAGNTATTTVHVTLDTRAPELTVSTPASDACLSVTELQVSGGAADSSLANVKVSAGTQSVDATLSSDHRTFTATLTALAEGKLTIRIEATDAIGHASVATVPVTIDRTKPVVTLTDAGLPFTATAVNRAVTPRVATTDLDETPSLAITLDAQPFENGTQITGEKSYELRAKATDCAGNVSDELVHRFTIDLTAPVVSFTNPANGATITTTPAIAGTLSEPATLVVEGRGTAIVNGLAFTLDGALNEGLNALVFLATDQAGNASRTPYSVTVDTSAPSVEITESGSPLPANAVYSRAVTPVIVSNDPSATIAATINGSPFTSGTAITADGTYTITAKATDPLGNQSATATASFVVDRSGPAIGITSPANGAVVVGDTVPVTGTASGASSVTVNTVPASLSGGVFSATLSLELGANLITAVATDAAGNTTTDSIEVERDPGKLTLLLTAPVDQTLTNRPATAVAGQILSVANVQKVTINDAEVPFDPAGAFRRLDVPLVEGNNDITVAVTSKSGQVSSVKVTVTADFTPPALLVEANGAALTDGARFATAPSFALEVTGESGAFVTKLMIDGELASPGVTPLADGGHALTATARDAAGNETRVDRVFFVGTVGSVGGGCSLSNFDPIQNAAVFGEIAHISGRSGGAASVLINGQAAAVADGSFCGDAMLVPGRNEVAIRCADASGQPTSEPAVTLVLYRYVDPQVTIAAPADLSTLTQARVAVSGTVGPGVTSGDVNGIAFTVPDDDAATHAFTVPEVPLSAGLNVLIVRARTRSSRIATASTRVTLRNAAPQISITSPLASSETGSLAIDVSGTYANVDPSTLVVKLGAATYAVAANALTETTGTFHAASVALAPDAVSTINVSGRNAANAQASVNVEVRHAGTAPRIAITSPTDNTILPSTQSGPVTVTGTYSGEGATVQVGGANATLTDGTFTAQVDLTGSTTGVTPVIARITTPEGRSATDAIRITRLSAPLTVRDSFPTADAEGVDPGVTIVALFSNPLDASTANALRVTDAGGTVLDGKVFVDRDAIAFAPAQPLRGQRYTVTIADTLKDASGASLGAAHSFSFSVGGTAPASAPIVDETTTTGCFSGMTLTGRVSTPGARARLDVDGVSMTTTSSETGAFKFTFSFSGQAGYHLVRVREIGADGTLSGERALCFRLSCAIPQVVSATLDRAAKTLSIQFSKAMDASTMSVGSSIVIEADGQPLAGTLSANAANDIATISFADVPRTSITLTVRKSVKDATGAALAADYTQAFAFTSDTQLGPGEGYVSGAVYDATTGRALDGATIAIHNPQSTVLNPLKGRYAHSMPEGAYTIQASAPNYTTVWRQVVVSAGVGVVPIDIRLTRRGIEATANGSVLTLTHGADTKITKKVELELAAASLPNGKRVRLTSVSGQSLAGLLPLGFSPLASAEITVDDSSAAQALPGAKLTFTIDASAVTAAAQSLSIAQYDSERDEWRAIVPAANIAADGKVTFDVPASGNYALVYPDKGATLAAPPTPRAGAPLRGVANPCITTPEVCRLTGKSFVLDPRAVLPNGRTVATLTVEGSPQFPSGTAVQAFIDEQLNLADGRTLYDPPFATDLLIHRTLDGSDGIADFHLAPSPQALGVILRDGVDHIRIVDYPGRIDRGTLIGAEGGRVPGDDIVTIDVPAGATTEPLHASVTSISENDVASFGAIPGFRVAGAFTFTLTRANEPAPVEGTIAGEPVLLTPAKATVTVASAILNPQSSIPQVVIVEVVPSTDYGAMFRLVAITSPVTSLELPDATVFATRPIVSTQLPLDGITREGQYLVLVAEAPIAYAYGQVRAAAAIPATGLAIPNARVTSGLGTPQNATLGVRDLTRIDGLFAIPVAARPATPFSLVARLTSTGDGATALASASPEPDTFVNFGVLTLSAQAPRLTSVTPSDGAEIDAASAVVVQATFDVAIDPTSINGSIVLRDLTRNLVVPGAATPSGVSTIRFNANVSLNAGTHYAVTIAPATRSANGAPFGRTVTTGFSIRAVASGDASIHPELIRITIPDANGHSVISGQPGALPAGAQVIAVRRGRSFIESYTATVAADRSFSFSAGSGDPSDRITISDAIDLQVLDPVSRAIIAIIELAPFVSPDGKGFVALVSKATRFTSADGITVVVPAGAFEEPTLVTVTTSAKSAVASISGFASELNWSGGVQLDFEGVAKARLQLEIPAGGTIDAAKQYLLGLLGQSMRGPRVMIVDTLRVDGTKFTTTNAPASNARVATNVVLTGSDVKNFLLGVNRSGIYAVVDIQPPYWGWSFLGGMQGEYDLFWDTLTSLYAADFYLADGRGRVAIPVVAGTSYTVTGVETATGLNAFASTYEPITPGAIVSVPPPAGENRGGPYPIYATPFRVEVLEVADDRIDIRDFQIEVASGLIVATTTLPDDIAVSVLNVTTGAFDPSRSGLLKVKGSVGDRIALYIAEHDVDPATPISIVFSEAIDTSVAPSTLFTLRKGGNDITGAATFAVDSGGRRVTLGLPATLERGAQYSLELSPQIADRGDPALRLGQVIDGPELSVPLRLELRVRVPAGELATFALSTGAIRDMAQSDNVLFYAALDGGLVAYDIGNPAAMTPSTPAMSVAPGDVTSYWAVATDHHGRVYATGVTNTFGVIRSFRVEDFYATGSTRIVDNAKLRGAAMLSWNFGATSSVGLGTGTVLSDRPEALPRKLQIATQDTEIDYASRAAFAAALSSNIVTTDSGRPDGLHKYRLEFAVPNGHPYRLQRITIENLTRGGRWSADAVKASDSSPQQKAILEDVVATENDRLRVRYNQRTYAVVSLFGYGISVYDLNAMESNDDPGRPASEGLVLEQVKLTTASLGDCTRQADLGSGAIESLTYSPEAVILGGETLAIDALETRRGVLDLQFSAAGGPTSPCLERAPVGLLFRSESSSGPIDHPRFAGPGGLRAKFRDLAGRDPIGRFNSVARYRWTLDGAKNAAGERGSEAGQGVVRDYLLIAGNDYGLLVVEAGGTPPVSLPGYWPLMNAHLVDVIWVPGGAYGVRAMTGSDYATVVDGAGRVLLVDLSRLDERWTAASGDSLFETVSKSLGANGSYGVGLDDPRIVWRSAPGVANSTLAPIADAETGYVYAGRLLEKVTRVLSALDPRLSIIDADDRSTTGVVPLGVPLSNDVGGAFRIEASLPGSITQSLPGFELRMAVESERVFGARTEDTPSGYPRAHLGSVTMHRMLPEDLPSSRWQRGYNRFRSDWIVPVADPRAARDWTGTRGDCVACERPASVAADASAKEIYSLGRFFHIRPEPNQFTLTPYAYLEYAKRFETRVATVPADTVRPAAVLVAPQQPPVAGGMLQETTYVHSGEVEVASTDLDAGGRAGWNVIVDRTFRSRTLGWTPFGHGWDSTLFRRLRQLPNHDVEYRDGEGEVWLFRFAANGEYTSPVGLPLRLKKTEGGWTLTNEKLRHWHFDELGRLARENDEFFDPLKPGSGNVIRYVYDANGRLTRIVDPVNRDTLVSYDAAGLIERVEEKTFGREIGYRFEGGALKEVLLPAVENTDNAARPSIRYTYMAAGAGFNDRVELATNLESIADPTQVATGGPARVKFSFEPTGANRDRVTSQVWGTGETAMFNWGSPTGITDVLGQERRYTLTTAEADAAGDRAHIGELREVAVPVYAGAGFGQLPDVPVAGAPPIASRDRVRTFAFPAQDETANPRGWAKSASLEGVRQTTMSFGSVNGVPAAHSLSAMQTLPLGGGGSAASFIPQAQPIMRSWHYQQTAGAYVAAMEANGARVESPEAHRYNAQPASTNDSVAATETYNELGQWTGSSASGGTDAQSAGAKSGIQYFASDDPVLYRRGLPELIRQGEEGDATTGAQLVTRMQYPAATRTIEIDSRGVATVTELDAWRRVKSVRTYKEGDPLVQESSYKYDASGRVREIVERKSETEQVTTNYTYDAMGRRTSTTTSGVATPSGSITDTTQYDLASRRIISSRVGGATTTTELDKLGRVEHSLTTTNSSPVEQRMAYDLDGNAVFQTDMLTASASAYDAHGRLVATRAADGTVATTEYDDWGRAKAVKYWNATATEVVGETTYDVSAAGRVKSVESKIDQGVSSTTTYAWDGGGRTTRTATNGRASVSKFDVAGRRKSTAAGAGSLSSLAETFTSSEVSRFEGGIAAATAQKDKSGATYLTQLQHDAAGNVREQSLGGLTWSQQHDSLGNVIEASEPNRPPTSWNVDARGAVKSETLPGGDAVNTFNYAESGAQNAYVDPESEDTRTDTDLIGRPVKRTYKDGTTEIVEWEGSRVKSVTDRQSRKQVYVYNAKGQIHEIRDGGGVVIDALTYDDAGRLVSWKNADSEIAWGEFNLAGNPKRTVQRRFKDGSGLSGLPQVLDEFVQEHRWNEHGERERFSMPTRPGATLGAGWTKWVGESFDAMGNLVSIARLDADVPTVTAPVMTASYFAAGRPEVRTVAVARGSQPVVRRYTYDPVDSLLKKVEVSIGGTRIAGSEVAHDGLQIGEARMLGVSSNERAARWTYDARSRVEASVYGARDDVQPTVPVPGRAAEHLTKADYREQQARTPMFDAATTSALQSRGIDPSRFDPPGTSFEKQPGGGHKIGKVARGPEVRPFGWQGAERVDDGRFVYVFDVKGRLISATEKTSVPPTRRLAYAYSGTGRVIGRRAEYTAAASPTAGDWKLEDRPQILAADGAPAETTYVWDPQSDRLISVYRAGATGDPLKQTIHGGAAYDDPLETTTTDPSTGAVTHLYPVYDEAAAGTMQAVVNERGEVVARNLSNDPYGDGDVPLLGVAVDRIAIEVKKNDEGTIATVDVTVHATEQLQGASVVTGARLGMVTTTGTIATSSPVSPALDANDPFTIRWTLTGEQWTNFTASPDATALSIAVTDTLRAAAWGSDVPVLPAPEWARATRPIFSTDTLPVELRESRTSLATFVGSVSAGEQKTSTLYELETLALAAAGGGSDALFEDVLSARFQALPFSEPVTGLVYARARWYDPSTGTFLSPDPLGYKDSSNLYAFAGGDPVNGRDPTGQCLGIDKAGRPCSEYARMLPDLLVDALGLNDIPSTGNKKVDKAIRKVAQAPARAAAAPTAVLLTTGESTGEVGYRLERSTFHGEQAFDSSVDDALLVAGAMGDVATVVAPVVMLKGSPELIGSRESQRGSIIIEGRKRRQAEDLVNWVDEGGDLRAGGSPGMRADAYSHQSSVPSARSNVLTGRGQAPYLEFTESTGNVIGAKFDGLQGSELIDRKMNPFFSAKAVDQATRQVAVAQHYGLQPVWELPTPEAVEAAKRFLKANNLSGITVRLTPR